MKKLSCLIFPLFLLLFFLNPCPIFADDYFFQDEFNQERADNTLNPDKWTIYPNAASGVVTVKETGGNLVTSQQTNTQQYPLIVSTNQVIPTGDFSAEVKFQYTEVTPWGTGFDFSEAAPVNGGGFGGNILFDVALWQDSSSHGPNMRVGFGGVDIFTTTINTNLHTFRVDRIGQKYLLYFDSQLIFTSPDTATQVKYFWLGNPSVQPPSIPDWTKFNVDYIRVKKLTVKTPVIFIPGIGGTQFKTKNETNLALNNGHGGTYTHTYPPGEQVWVNTNEAAKPGEDDYFDILKLKADGQTPEADLALVEDLFAGSYPDTIKFFNDNGYTSDQDFFMFPYDWRKDLSLTGPLLDQKINQILNQTGAQKVDIVTHSMGGLVARNYIQDPQRAIKVRKLIELGVPHLGSVDLLRNLHYGGCLLGKFGPFCAVLAPSELKDVIQNMISGFELVPTATYYSFYSGEDDQHPFPIRDDADLDNNNTTGPLNYTQTKVFLTNLGHNTTLFNPTETFHQLDNSLTNSNGVDVTIISGSGIATLGQIIEKNTLNFAGIKIPKKDLLMVNGDKTVPLFSSSLIDSSKNLSLLGSAKTYYTSQQHSSLSANGPSLTLTKNILNNDTTIPNGIASSPIPLNGRLVSVHSPVNLNIIDQNGNHTGPTSDGNFEENIPGSSYEILDDAKFIWLANSGQYNINLAATSQGSFDLKVRTFENNTDKSTIIYKDIPVATTTKADTVLDTSSIKLPILNIDTDGNGTTDQQLSPTGVINVNENTDKTPPEVQINFNIKTQNLEINGLDNLAGVQVFDLQTGLKLIKDLADNFTKIDFEPKNKAKKDSINLKNISYQNGSPITFPSNKFEVFYQEKKTAEISQFTQKITIKGEELAKADFNQKTNKTTITIKKPDRKKVTEEKNGIVLLNLTTQNGGLDIAY